MVRARYESLLHRLLTLRPSIWSTVEVWSNDVFPIATSLTLNLTGPDRDEDVILSARCLVKPPYLDFDSEISREDGQILLPGPNSRIALYESNLTKVTWVESKFDSYFDFLRDNVPLILRELGILNEGTRQI